VKTEVIIIKSETLALKVIQALELYANPHFAGKNVQTRIRDLADLTPSQRQELLNNFRNRLTVKVIPATQVVEIRFRSPDSEMAANVANSLVDEYVQRNLAARVDGTAQLAQWVSRRMQEIRASTMAAREKLVASQRAESTLATDVNENLIPNRFKQLNEELTQATANRIVKEGLYRLASSGNAEVIGSLAPSTTLRALRTQETDLSAQQAQLSATFGNSYPRLREIHERLGEIKDAIQTEQTNITTLLASEYDTAAKAESTIRNQLEGERAEAYSANEHGSHYAILKDEVEFGQQLYDMVQLKLKETNMASGTASPSVSVVDRAQVSDRPVEPRKALYLAVGLVGGFFGGLILGIVMDSFDDTVRTSRELEALTVLPELGTVPRFATGSQKKRLKRAESSELVSDFDPITVREPNSPAAEAYRALCSTTLLASPGNPPRLLVVTSAMPGEGKSTVSRNLAALLAQRAKRVLLVDADLRCSSIQAQLGERPGLSTIFAAAPDSYHCYQPLAALPNLDVVPAGFRPRGSMGPTEILASGWMQQQVARWRSEYDHVIVDTPPVVPFADALILAARADGVILVARSEVSRTESLLRARDLLSRSGANILGFVLNGVKRPKYYYEYPSRYRAQYVRLSGSSSV